VRGVATGASRGDGQAALRQALAVNTLRIVLNDFVLASGVANGCFLAFAMTASAKSGHVGRESHRDGIMLAQDVMCTVTVLADGRVVVARGLDLAVAAALILLADFLVAFAAINRVSNGLAGPHMRSVHLGVALAARNLGVARPGYVVNLDK